MKRLAPEWRNYCIYSGNYLPDEALNKEHVIPQSLGGYNSTLIRVSKSLNARFGTDIDGALNRDIMIEFGRRDAQTRSHKGNVRIPRAKKAQRWNKSDPWDKRHGRYEIDFPKDGLPKVRDTKNGQIVPSAVWSNGGFVVPNLQIEHDARMKFTVKTLIGLGWKLFGPDFLPAMHTEFLRSIITNTKRKSGEPSQRLIFIDRYLIPREDQASHVLTKLKDVIVRKNQTAVLLREWDSTFEWTVACVGELVGSIRVQLTAPLLRRTDIEPGGGLRLIVRPGTLNFEVIPAISE
jgi:hypothetical protein